MDCVMKSRISRWRSVRAPRVSSRTNVNEPMFSLRLSTERTYRTEQMYGVNLIRGASLAPLAWAPRTPGSLRAGKATLRSLAFGDGWTLLPLEEGHLKGRAGAEAPGGEDGSGRAVDGGGVAHLCGRGV